MDILKALSEVKDIDFNRGDIIEVIEITDIDMYHKMYCEQVGIKKGTIMVVSSISDKDYNCCTEEDRFICDKVNKNKCISLVGIDDRNKITHSCYTRFRKVRL